jgi:cell shape-determining protein MreC
LSTGSRFGKVDDLIEAFDEKDDQAFKDLIKNYLSYAVDNEVLKLANKIVKSEEWLKETQQIKKKETANKQTVTKVEQLTDDREQYKPQSNTANARDNDVVTTKMSDLSVDEKTNEGFDKKEAEKGDEEDEFADGLL